MRFMPPASRKSRPPSARAINPSTLIPTKTVAFTRKVYTARDRIAKTMFVLHSLPIAIFFCIITMLGWGSWANTQKLSGKDQWRFELYYWDYAIGVLLFGFIYAFTFGSMGAAGQCRARQFQPSFTSRHPLRTLQRRYFQHRRTSCWWSPLTQPAWPSPSRRRRSSPRHWHGRKLFAITQRQSHALFAGVALIVFAMVMSEPRLSQTAAKRR